MDSYSNCMCMQCYLVYMSASCVFILCSVEYFSMRSVVSQALFTACVGSVAWFGHRQVWCNVLAKVWQLFGYLCLGRLGANLCWRIHQYCINTYIRTIAGPWLKHYIKPADVQTKWHCLHTQFALIKTLHCVYVGFRLTNPPNLTKHKYLNCCQTFAKTLHQTCRCPNQVGLPTHAVSLA